MELNLRFQRSFYNIYGGLEDKLPAYKDLFLVKKENFTEGFKDDLMQK